MENMEKNMDDTESNTYIIFFFNFSFTTGEWQSYMKTPDNSYSVTFRDNTPKICIHRFWVGIDASNIYKPLAVLHGAENLILVDSQRLF